MGSSGDEIAFLRPDDRSPAGTAKAIAYRLITPTEFELELEDDIPEGVDVSCSLENLSNTPSVICRNNYFGSCRARGILVTTPGKVRIEDNIFESSGSAIVITGDVREWYESGTCTDVKIRRNQFLDCCTSQYQFCDGVIHIEPGVDEQSDMMVHRNIRIEDNLFLQGKETLLFADHTGEIRFCGNWIWAGKESMPGVVLRKCEDVSVRDNIINGRRSDTKMICQQKEEVNRYEKTEAVCNITHALGPGVVSDFPELQIPSGAAYGQSDQQSGSR